MMPNKIAVIVDDSKTLSSFEAGSNIDIYCKYGLNWNLENEIAYSLNHSATMSEIRDYIRTVILKLEDCKIIIGKTVVGLPYNIFDRIGFEIFETDFISDSILDEIFFEVAENTNENINSQSTLPTSPVQTEIEGIYFLDLIELQEKHPEISSKKALQTFLTTTPFYKLELICSHVPPWFDNVFPARKLTYSIEELQENKLKVTICKKVCEC
jgi:Fe-only nitrogenase accessory protein AnfO